jgi:hypothetical protein
MCSKGTAASLDPLPEMNLTVTTTAFLLRGPKLHNPRYLTCRQGSKRGERCIECAGFSPHAMRTGRRTPGQCTASPITSQ